MPYWRLDDESPERPTLLSLTRRLTKAVGPVWRTVRTAAPRASEIILLAQVFSGAATTLVLLLTTRVLGIFLTQGPISERLQATLPTLLILGLVLLLRMTLDAAVLSAKAHLIPKVHRVAEEQLFKADFRRVDRCAYGETRSPYAGIVELDNREEESLFVEAIK